MAQYALVTLRRLRSMAITLRCTSVRCLSVRVRMTKEVVDDANGLVLSAYISFVLGDTDYVKSTSVCE
jgi:hypothetical protein